MFEQLGLNVARQPDNAANPRPDNRSGWLDGETPDVVGELIGASRIEPPTPDERPTLAAGFEIRLWDPSTQLRFRAKRTVPPRPDGAPNARRIARAAGVGRGADGRRGQDGRGGLRTDTRATREDAMNGELEAGEIEERLAELEHAGLTRRLRLVSGPQGPTVLLDGKPVLLLCSNNYLGLADHPRVREAAAEAAMRWGVGAGASRLISGTMTVHRRLEERLAGFAGRQSCLLFGSGYLANLGVIGALAGRGDTVFSDELNHASIVDGCRLSRAEVVVYRHADVEHLLWSMRRHSGRGEAQGGRLIVTDSVFSMDGDVAPLAEIVELAHASGARVVVDEAHAIGTYGRGGRGVLAEQGLEGEVDAIVGTLGKALGSYGAYVCGDEEMVRYLLNTSRSFIFSTAPPPPAMAGALAALELLQERPHRVERLNANARTLRRALAVGRLWRRRRRHAHRAAGRRRRARHAAPLPGGDRARRVRPGDQTTDRAAWHLAPAPGGDGLAHSHRHAYGRRRSSRRRRASSAWTQHNSERRCPSPSPSRFAQPDEAREREMYEATVARSTQPAPFDVEQPRPRRPPAPAREDMGEGNAPFDGERESAVAHAA